MTLIERLETQAKALEQENHHTEASTMREAIVALREAALLLLEAQKLLLGVKS